MKNKPRTLKDLRNHPWVESVDKEDGNGYWLYLADGYWAPHFGTISLHEFTVSKLCEEFSYCIPGHPED